MVTHRRSVLALLVLSLALVAACDKVPLLAPTGSVITLIPVTTTVSLNSQVTIIATVIENGQASSGGAGSGAGTTTRTGAGTPVQNGTLITFTTTLGRIEPAEARTHNGQVSVRLITGGASGTATITAYSGGASATKELKVGTAAAKSVSVTTTPQSLGATGGTTQVVATVVDEGGSPLAGVPVTFSTDKGSISPSTVTTDASGTATATLTTTSTSKITAAVGSLTGTATVTVSARSLIGFNAEPSSASAGVSVRFTVRSAPGANISNVRIDFGDGTSTDLGAIGGDTTVAHTYTRSGNYTATATASPDGGSLSTSVSIGSLAVTLSANPSSPKVGEPVTLRVDGVGTAQVDHYIWTIDEGTGTFTTTTTSPQLSYVFTTPGAKNVRVDVIGVGGGQIGTASLRLVVSAVP